MADRPHIQFPFTRSQGQRATYESAVVADKPVGYWRLGEASGVVAEAEVGPNGSYLGSQVPNQVTKNPSFEIDNSGWGVSVGVTLTRVQDAPAGVGGYCGEVVTPGTVAGEGLSQNMSAAGVVDCLAGVAYTLSLYVKGAVGGEQVNATVYDPTAGLNVSTPMATLTTGWQRISVTFTSPADAHVSLYIRRGGAITPATWRVDGIQFVRGSAVVPYSDTQGNTLGWPGAIPASHDTAVKLDGLSGCVNVPANARFQTPLFSGEIWANGNSTPTAQVQRPLVADCLSPKGWLIQYNTGLASVGMYDSAGAWHASANIAVPLGSWHHFVVTYDGTTLRLYVDGVLATSFVSSYTVSTVPIAIGVGARYGAGWPFNGAIDEAAIYDYALSADQVASHYAAGIQATEPLVVSSQVGVIEQDTVEHIMSCEMVITVCPLGARDDRPEFGWAWPDLSTPPLDTAALQTALENFEPRADVEVTQYADLIDAATQFIKVQVEIESDGSHTY
ncbi:MAG TPA: LamG-like jellyroll fold domain-containing protein [Casimicrobiaceae bacterium]|jgi:phage baseplate assembly protein W